TGTILVACSTPASPPAATTAPSAGASTAPTKVPPPTSAATATPQAAKPAATTAASTQSQGKTTIVFWSGSTSPSAQAGWDALAKSFGEKNPTLGLQRVTQANMGTIIKVALSSGTGPDAFEGDVVPAYIQPLVDAKLLNPLDDYYKSLPNLGKVFAWARANATFGGKTWGVPHEVEFIPLFYNKGVFAKAGITEPPTKSYDD